MVIPFRKQLPDARNVISFVIQTVHNQGAGCFVDACPDTVAQGVCLAFGIKKYRADMLPGRGVGCVRAPVERVDADYIVSEQW